MSQSVAANGSTTTQRPPRTVRRHFWTWRRVTVGFLLLVIVAVAGLGFVPTTRWVNCSGYIMTDLEAELRPSVEGAIAEWTVGSRDQVKKNQVVMRLKDSVQRAALDQAQADLKARRAQLQQLLSAQQLDRGQREQQIRQARASLALAQSNLDRMARANDGGGAFSQKEIENAKLRVDLAQSQLDELLIPRDDFMDDQIQVLREQIESSEKNVALRTVELEMRQVRAPLSGTVFFNHYEPGEVVKPEHVLGQVFDESHWVVKLKVSERQIGYLRVGQHVDAALAAYPTLLHGYLPATVSRILPVVTPRNAGDGVFYIEATIDDAARFELHPGMTVSAFINAGDTNWIYRTIGW